MGFDSRGIVVLSGGHNVGTCHPDFSGYDGPWTTAKNAFTNMFYT